MLNNPPINRGNTIKTMIAIMIYVVVEYFIRWIVTANYNNFRVISNNFSTFLRKNHTKQGRRPTIGLFLVTTI